MQDEVIVLHPGDADKAGRTIAGRSFTWFYLGQDTAQRENISRVMGRENRRFLGDWLLEIAEEQKQPYLDFLAGLGREQKNQRNWWASDISYRNPLTSDFFQLWCYAALFEKLCGESRNKQSLQVVFIQDRWLYKHLWQRYRNSIPGLRFLSRKWLWPEAARLSARFIAYRLYFLQRALRHFIGSRRFASQKGQATSKAGENSRRVYIYSLMQERFFPKSGEFHDAFFGRLPAILAKNGIDVAYITPLFLPAKQKSKCLAYGGFDFTFLDSFLRPGDILKSFFAGFRIDSGKEPAHMKTLLQRQVLHEVFFHNPLAYYFALKRWLKENDREKIAIIYPFENQPWEKMLCVAAAESGRNVRLVAYQHSTIPSFLLNYFLGAGESSDMPLPQCIVADSVHTLEVLRKAGYGATKLVNGGALRYEYLHRARRDIPRKEENKPRTVLVALPYLYGLVQEMLLAVFNAFTDLNTVEILIKFHPATAPERLGIRLPAWPAHFKETRKGVTEILSEVDLVVCWSSTMVLEMFLTGVPVIRYRSENTMGIDSREEMNEIAVKSCRENDMRDVILAALNENNNPSQESGGDIARFFSPVNEEVWREVVKC
jgi:hypothetical protein